MFNFFTSAGAFLKQGASNVYNFIKPGGRQSANIALPPQIQTSKRPLFNSTGFPRAEAANLTTQASTTRLSAQKVADTGNFFTRTFATPSKQIFETAQKVWGKATAGFKNIFKPSKVNILKKQTVNAATELGSVAIRSLTDLLSNKISTGIGQSGTPIDRRPLVENKAPSTSAEGKSNFLGGFEFPFLASLLQPRSSIPTVMDTGRFPDTSSIVVSSGASVPETGSPGDLGNTLGRLTPLLIIGVAVFFFLKRGK